MRIHTVPAAVFAALLFAAPAGAAQSPEAVVASFYKWYVACSKFVPGKTVQCDYLGKDLGTQRDKLTPRFYSDLAEATALQNELHHEITAADPFNGTQMSACSYKAGRASRAGASATVPVSLALCPMKRIEIVTVKLQQIAGRWRIADVIAPGSGSQDAIIAKAIKAHASGKQH
jgi:hypothetical protein